MYPIKLPPRTWHDDLLAELLNERIPQRAAALDGPSWLSMELLYVVAQRNDPEMFLARDAWPTAHDMVLATARWQPLRTALPSTLECYWFHDPETIPIEMRTRPSWPRGAAVYIDVGTSHDGFVSETEIRGSTRSDGGADWRFVLPAGFVFAEALAPYRSIVPNGVWSDGLTRVSPSDDDSNRYTFDLSAWRIEQVHFTGAQRWCERPVWPPQLDVSFARVAAPLLRPVTDAPLTDWLAHEFQPCITSHDASLPDGKLDAVRLNLYLSPTALAHRLHGAGLTLGLRIEVIAGGDIIGRAQAWYRADENKETPERPYLMPRDIFLPVEWTDDALEHLQSGEEIRVRIRGDHDVALRDFDATAYWAGEIEAVAEVPDEVRAMKSK